MSKVCLKLVLVAFFISAFSLFISCSQAKRNHYTFRTNMETCSQWDPTCWPTNSDSLLLSFITSPLYDIIPNEDGSGHKVIPELAASLPVDVTREYSGNKVYGVPEDATEGYAWKINIVPGAVWNDGTPIDASTVEYTLQKFLDPKLQNYRGAFFYADGLSIANAREYFAGRTVYNHVTTPEAYLPVKDEDLWTSIYKPVYFLSDYSVLGYGGEFWHDNPVGKDLWNRLLIAFGTDDYVRLTPERKALLQELAILWGEKNSNAYKEFCFTKQEREKLKWKEVGFVMDDVYSFTLILDTPVTPFMLEYNLGALRLVKEDVYEASIVYDKGKFRSTYGTSLDNTCSYGPYKLVKYSAGKALKLEKNEAWYGWDDGRHEKEYQTTDIYATFEKNHNAVVNNFLKGELDSLELEQSDLTRFKDRYLILSNPEPYTCKITFNSDRASLETQNEPGFNHSILANENFRLGVAYSINRELYIKETRPLSTPGYGLINNSYIADPQSGLLYRDTPEAKSVLQEFYGTNKGSLKSTNLEKARKYMQLAYDQEVQAGYLSPDDLILINFYVYSLSEVNINRRKYFEQCISWATWGTPLENRVFINLIENTDYYQGMENGKVDMAVTAWGGNELDPWNIMWCYCTPDNKNEFGYDPETDMLTIELEDRSITKSMTEWYESLCNGEYKDSSSHTKTVILASMEKQLLKECNVVPLEYLTTMHAYSLRIKEQYDQYVNPLVSRGGIRFMTYTMDDHQWKHFCRKKHHRLY